MSAEFQFDVSPSHNQADKPRVRRLAERLRAAGLYVWFDEWVVKPGEDICLAIERELEAGRVLACRAEASRRRRMRCLTSAALGSDWVSLHRTKWFAERLALAGQSRGLDEQAEGASR